MKLITTLATATLALTTTLPAQAQSNWSCFTLTDSGQRYGEICNRALTDKVNGIVKYEVQYTNNTNTGKREESDLTIECRGMRVVDWKSYGNLSNEQNDWVAEKFCSYD